MSLSRMLQRLRAARPQRGGEQPVSPEPLDHPSLAAMRWRELADLPVEPPATAARDCLAHKTK
jgi:hypothetical protein